MYNIGNSCIEFVSTSDCNVRILLYTPISATCYCVTRPIGRLIIYNIYYLEIIDEIE